MYGFAFATTSLVSGIQLLFMGPAPATPATRYPLLYLALTSLLFVLAIAGRKRQLLI